MGKRKNVIQHNILMEYMKNHPSLARGFCKGNKATQEERWMELTDILNEAGPPCKDITSWKKTWIDSRLLIQKKISNNKTELTCTEKEIAVLCNLTQNFDDINEQEYNEINDGISSTSNSHTFSIEFLSAQSPKKRKTESNSDTFEETIAQHSKAILNGEEKSHVACAVGDLAKKLDSIDKKLDQMGRKYDILIELKREQIEEMRKDRQERKRHNLEIEKYNNLMLGKYSPAE